MRVNYDRESDAPYIVGHGPTHGSEDLDKDIRVEDGEKRKTAGIEVQDARRKIGKAMAKETAEHVKAVT